MKSPHLASREARWSVAVGVCVVAPLLVVAVIIMTDHAAYRPGFDNALMELRVRDVWNQVVYTGPYSRFGWYHPGPLLFYLFALPYRLFGQDSRALAATALFINASALGISLWMGFRIARLAGLLWIALPTIALMRALGPNLLHSPWNPDVVILSFGAFIAAAWAVGLGDRWMTVVLVVFGSLVVQSHVGDALPVALFALGALWMGRRSSPRSTGTRRWFRRPGVVSGALLLALWALPLVGDVIVGNRNLRHVGRFALSGGASSSESVVGTLAALKLVGAQWGPRPLWLVGSASELPFRGAVAFLEARWWLPIALVPAIVVSVIAFRRRDRRVIVLAILVALGEITAVISVRSIRGPSWSYLTWWVWVVGAWTGVLLLAGLWTALPVSWRERATTMLALVTIGAAVWFGARTISDVARDSVPSDTVGLTIGEQRALAQSVNARTAAVIGRSGTGPVVLDSTYGVLEAPGIALALERAGIPVKVVGRDASVPYGPNRQWRCGKYRAWLRVYSGDENVALHARRGEVIARWSVNYPAAKIRALKLSRYAWLNRPDSPERTRQLEGLDSQLNGPRYLVQVNRLGPGQQACAARG